MRSPPTATRVAENPGTDSTPARRPLPRVLDREAMAGIYLGHRDQLEHLARGILHSRDAAEDAVHQAFERTLKALEAGVEIRSPKSWLRRCVTNACLDELRRRRSESLGDAIEWAATADESLAEMAHVAERCRAVHDALGGLPDSQRSAFLLAEIRGLSGHEIAVAIGRTQSAVQRLLYRARKHVRETVGSASALLMGPFGDRAAQLAPQGLTAIAVCVVVAAGPAAPGSATEPAPGVQFRHEAPVLEHQSGSPVQRRWQRQSSAEQRGRGGESSPHGVANHATPGQDSPRPANPSHRRTPAAVPAAYGGDPAGDNGEAGGGTAQAESEQPGSKPLDPPGGGASGAEGGTRPLGGPRVPEGSPGEPGQPATVLGLAQPVTGSDADRAPPQVAPAGDSVSGPPGNAYASPCVGERCEGATAEEVAAAGNL